eukprot:gene41925-62361_t
MPPAAVSVSPTPPGPTQREGGQGPARGRVHAGKPAQSIVFPCGDLRAFCPHPLDDRSRGGASVGMVVGAAAAALAVAGTCT